MSNKGEKDFLHGVAWALSVLTKGFGEPTTAALIAAEGSFTAKDFVKAGVEETDLEEWIDELRKMEARGAEKKKRRNQSSSTVGGHHGP